MVDRHTNQPMGLRQFRPGFAANMRGWRRGEPIRYLEIGVAEGGSAVWVWRNLLVHEDCTADLVDPWEVFSDASHKQWSSDQFAMDAMYRTATSALAPWAERTRIFRMTSAKFFAGIAGDLIRPRYDLIYVDGCHTYEDARHDLLAASLVIDPVEGLIVADDVRMEGVMDAIAEFHREYVDAKQFKQFAIQWRSRHQICYKHIGD